MKLIYWIIIIIFFISLFLWGSDWFKTALKWEDRFFQCEEIRRDFPEALRQAESMGYGKAEGFYIEFCDCWDEIEKEIEKYNQEN